MENVPACIKDTSKKYIVCFHDWDIHCDSNRHPVWLVLPGEPRYQYQSCFIHYFNTSSGRNILRIRLLLASVYNDGEGQSTIVEEHVKQKCSTRGICSMSSRDYPRLNCCDRWKQRTCRFYCTLYMSVEGGWRWAIQEHTDTQVTDSLTLIGACWWWLRYPVVEHYQDLWDGSLCIGNYLSLSCAFRWHAVIT